MVINVIERFGEPSKMDLAPYATLCKVLTTGKSTVDLYAQISHNDDDPIWNFIGTFPNNLEKKELRREFDALFIVNNV